MIDPTVLELLKAGGVGGGILIGFYMHARTIKKNGNSHCAAEQTLEETQRTNSACVESLKGMCISLDRNTRAVEDQGRTLLALVQRKTGKE